MMTDEMKPCPFCGNEAALVGLPTGNSRWRIYCKSCQVWGPYAGESAESALAAWNKRASEGEAKPVAVHVTKEDERLLASALLAGQQKLYEIPEAPDAYARGRKEAVETAAKIAEGNKLHWAAKVDPCKPNDPSRAIYRAKSAACFQIETDIRSLKP